jgi:hypothetical protein
MASERFPCPGACRENTGPGDSRLAPRRFAAAPDSRDIPSLTGALRMAYGEC